MTDDTAAQESEGASPLHKDHLDDLDVRPEGGGARNEDDTEKGVDPSRSREGGPSSGTSGEWRDNHHPRPPR